MLQIKVNAFWIACSLLPALVGCKGQRAEDGTGLDFPAHVGTLDLQSSIIELPPELQNDSSLVIETHDRFGTVLGSERGLYAVAAGELELLDDTVSIVGMGSTENGIAVGTNEALMFWSEDGLTSSQLSDSLGSGQINDVVSTGNQLWVATANGLFLLENGTLLEFDGVSGPTNIVSYQDARYTSVQDAAGQWTVLRTDDAQWGAQSLDTDDFAHVFPSTGDRLWGIAHDGDLYQRQVSDGAGRTAWIAASLSDEVDAPAEKSLKGWGIDRNTGAVWLLRENTLALVQGDRVLIAEVPTYAEAFNGVHVTSDGAVWLQTATRLVRLTSTGERATYADTIEAVYETHCSSCHNADGMAHDLNGQELWANEIDSIIDSVESGQMPPNGAALPDEDVSALYFWREQGLQ